MANIAFIEANVQRLLDVTQAAQDKKEEKENPTDHDQEIIDALSEFYSQVEAAFEDLKTIYEDK